MKLLALAAAAALATGVAVTSSRSQPLNLNALYQAAAPGATVRVPAGDYSSQRIVRDPGNPAGAAPVTLSFAPGARIVGTLDLGDGTSGPDGIVLDRPAARYLRIQDASRVTVNEPSVESWDVFRSEDVRIVGGSTGPCRADATKACVPRVAGSRRVEVDRHLFRGITSSDLVAYHVDGLAIFGSQDVTVRRSIFRENWITNVRVQNCCGNPPLRNVRLEQNWFGYPLAGDGTTRNANAVDIDSPVPGLYLAYNSLAPGSYFSITGNQTGTGARLVGNLIANVSCEPGVSREGNLFTPWSEFTGQTACGTDTKVAGHGYTDAAATDFRLLPSAPAYASRALYEQPSPVPAPGAVPPTAGLAPPALTLAAYTQRTVTVAWQPVARTEGYRFYLDGQLIASTHDPARASVRVGVSWGRHLVAVEAFAGSAAARGRVAVEGRWIAETAP